MWQESPSSHTFSSSVSPNKFVWHDTKLRIACQFSFPKTMVYIPLTHPTATWFPEWEKAAHKIPVLERKCGVVLTTSTVARKNFPHRVLVEPALHSYEEHSQGRTINLRYVWFAISSCGEHCIFEGLWLQHAWNFHKLRLLSPSPLIHTPFRSLKARIVWLWGVDGGKLSPPSRTLYHGMPSACGVSPTRGWVWLSSELGCTSKLLSR